MRSQVRDLGATRELLAHHLSDLDDILAALRIRNGAFPSARSRFSTSPTLRKQRKGKRTTVASATACPCGCLGVHSGAWPNQS